MRCDIIIPIWNQKILTAKCIESIIRYTDFPYRLILVDNGSEPETKTYLERLAAEYPERVFLIRNETNLGWVGAINQGLKESNASEYVSIQNNDIEVSPGWLRGLIDVAQCDKKIGLVNPSWESDNPRSNDRYTEIDYCRGFCMLIKREVINKIGGLDTAYGMGYYDDWDYSERAIKEGYICARANKVKVVHHKEKSFSAIFSKIEWNKLFEKNKAIFYAKWGKPLKIFLALEVTKGNLDKDELSGFISALLRRQHKVELVVNKTIDPGIRHTNLVLSVRRKILFQVSVLVIIFDNLFRSPKKRYDLIVTNSEHIYKKIGYLKLQNSYKIYRINLKSGFLVQIKEYLNENFPKGTEANVL